MARSIKQALRSQAEVSYLTESSLAKIAEHRHLNAFTYLHSQKNVEDQLVSIKSRTGPLQGIPIAIKDNFCVRGIPTTCGSKMLMNFVPPYNATVVQKLVDAGAVIIGKTNLDEFGMGNGTLDSIFGPTKNIWGLNKFMTADNTGSFSDWHVPGGSSGGSAVSVATGMCFAALGSDTGGSTRNPASYCGVVGLKPTYGLLSRFGLIPLVNSMDVPGILTRTVEDCATILDVIKGHDPLDSTSSNVSHPQIQMPTRPEVNKLRIGVSDDFLCEGMMQDVIDCWTEVTEVLGTNGAVVTKVSLPHTKYSIACYSVLNPCEVASNMARYDGLRFGHRSSKKNLNSTEALYAQTRHEGFNSVVRGRILAGNYFLLKANYDKYFTQALKIRRLISQDFLKAWSSVDVLVTPVTLSVAPQYSDFVKLDNRTQSSLQDYCTQSANMSGVPALSLPIKLNSKGLPVSVQLIAPHFREDVLLSVAQFLENHYQFPHRYYKYNQ